MSYKTNKRLPAVKISDGDILKVTVKRDPNKALSHNKISIRKIKIRSASIFKLLSLIFNYCIDNGIYSFEWKKDVLCQFTKKVTNEPLKIFVQCLYFQFAVKFFNDF